MFEWKEFKREGWLFFKTQENGFGRKEVELE